MDLSKIIISKLNSIPTQGGDVLHACKSSDIGFIEFGEVYFSWIKAQYVKAWKRHSLMTLNLVVPIGLVKFVFFLDNDPTIFRKEVIGSSNYCRLTVPPGIWFGFQGISKESSLVVNIADIEHDDNEISKIEKSKVKFNWD